MVQKDDSEWEKVTITVDSGAVDIVGPRNIAKAFKVNETAASRRGMTYRAANGSPIPNEGKKKIKGSCRRREKHRNSGGCECEKSVGLGGENDGGRD